MQEKAVLSRLDPPFPCEKVVWLEISGIGRGAMGRELNGCSAFTKPFTYVLNPGVGLNELEELKKALEEELAKP